MNGTDYGRKTEQRRKRLMRAVAGALAATALVVVVAYHWKLGGEEKQAPSPAAVPSNVNQQLAGYSFTRSDNGERIFTVHAARTVAFQENGATVLHDVLVEVFGRSGVRHDLMRTAECDYNRQTGELLAPGRVEIELNAPAGLSAPEAGAKVPAQGLSRSAAERAGRERVFLETSRVSLDRQGMLAASDQQVRFRVGPLSGSARGLSYAPQKGWLELKQDVAADLPPGERAMGPVRLTAARLDYDKRSGEIRLGGPVRITQANRQVSAGRGKIQLDAHHHVVGCTLEGGVEASVISSRGVLRAGAASVQAAFNPDDGQARAVTAEGGVKAESNRDGRLMRLAARQVAVSFLGRPARPVRGDASGDVRLLSGKLPMESASLDPVAAAKGKLSSSEQELSAAEVRFDFLPKAWTLAQATTVGEGKLVVTPESSKIGPRVILAKPIQMIFDTRNHLKTLLGHSQARIVFLPSPQAPQGVPAESSSQRLEARFNPAKATLETVDQTGEFHYREGGRQASSDRARYVASTEKVTLTGDPRVWDSDTHARADRIFVNMGSEEAQGLGHVRATHREKTRQGALAGATEQVNVVADRMLAKRNSQFVHYAGHVRLWQGQDVLESSSMDVFKSEGRVESGDRVLTSFFQPASHLPQDAGPSAGTTDATRPVTIRADHLEYFDGGRKANYRGHVTLETENTTLDAGRLDVYFSAGSGPGASEVERAVAEGHVRVTQPGRRATGEHAEYFAAPGKLVVVGGPPALYDAEKGFTTGRRLTFFLRDDRIFLDGGEDSQTLSKHRVPQ